MISNRQYVYSVLRTVLHNHGEDPHVVSISGQQQLRSPRRHSSVDCGVAASICLNIWPSLLEFCTVNCQIMPEQGKYSYSIVTRSNYRD